MNINYSESIEKDKGWNDLTDTQKLKFQQEYIAITQSSFVRTESKDRLQSQYDYDTESA